MFNIKQSMRTGLILSMAYPEITTDPGAFLPRLRQTLCDDYFDAVEVPSVADDKIRACEASLLRQSAAGIVFSASSVILQQGLNPNCLEEEGRSAASRALCAMADEAALLGAESLTFLAGTYRADRITDSVAALAKTTRELCAHVRSATDGRMNVVLELFDYDVDKCSLMGPAILGAAFAKELRTEFEDFGLLLDLSHLPLTRETPHAALEQVAPYLTNAHIGNAVTVPGMPAYGDKHPRFGYPLSANGVPQVADFLKELSEHGFFEKRRRPIVSFEVKPQPGEDPDIVVANAKRVLNAASRY